LTPERTSAPVIRMDLSLNIFLSIVFFVVWPFGSASSAVEPNRRSPSLLPAEAPAPRALATRIHRAFSQESGGNYGLFPQLPACVSKYKYARLLALLRKLLALSRPFSINAWTQENSHVPRLMLNSSAILR